MSWALPLPVAIPLIAAALLVMGGAVLPRPVQDAIAIAASATATAFALLILEASERHVVLHWFGGWHPHHGLALGISFAADPLGAGMAALACGLDLIVLVYSWTYMRRQSQTFVVLVLTLGGAMAGFALTGDIFNMFVWFELSGVSAYALAGFMVEELGPLQGAINFAITNTVGAYMILMGIALLYARTGALNLAQIGRTLEHRPADRLVIVAFALIVTGLMVRAAIVPFHFWLADAHAASPVPVCTLLSGAVVTLGIFFITRVYWTAFAGALHAHEDGVRDLLVALGVLTALLGAVMSVLQRHVKRLLAYSTISQAGLMLSGIALLDPRSLAGVANLVVAHGLLKGGLFLVCGIILVELRDIDELRLHGAGRSLPVTAVLWLLGTIGLVGIPPVGVFLGLQLVGQGASEQGFGWLAAIGAIASGICAGAMLRAGARIFLGWGAKEDDLLSPEPDEQALEHDASVGLMAAVAGVVIVIGLAASLVPGLETRTLVAAERFADTSAYRAAVLHGAAHGDAAAHLSFSLLRIDTASALYGLAALLIAAATAALGLWHRRLPEASRRLGSRLLWPPVTVVRNAHSGIVGDYLLWLSAGATAVAAVWALTL
ncbi:MAG TPA: proton-conducting transporter membrane subunit [Gaiellales bacterium]|nr:proton-conducting transporter membrane subunit [Gaiellales bacterium]